MWKVAVVAAALACGALTACSPYVFTDNVQTFSSKMGVIDSSYQDSEQKIGAEQRLSDRIEWIRDKPALAAGPGCSLGRTNPTEPCNLVRTVAKRAAVANAQAADSDAADSDVKQARAVAPANDVCEPAHDAIQSQTSDAREAMPPVRPAQLLKTLDNYIAALAAITKAQDRTDFDNAAAKVSAAVEGLAKSAPPPYSAAAPVAKASSNAVLWLVGQDLDYRRLQQLQNATQTACEPIHYLAAALGVELTGQRRVRLRGLRHLLGLKIDTANMARSRPHMTDQTYGAAIDDAQSAADALQTVRATDPQAAPQALSDAHDALVVAVRNNDGQFAALVASLQTFAQQANALATAAAATSSSPAPTVTKS